MLFLFLYIQFQTGDIIFQESISAQSEAIQLATGSRFSHVGIVLEKNNDLFVLEASKTVRLAPLNQWINRGKNGDFITLRPSEPRFQINYSQLLRIQSWLNQNLGKQYDPFFEWDDEKLYCSELVWKFFSDCFDIQLSHLSPLHHYNLEHPLVQELMKKRWAEQNPPKAFVAPKYILESNKLEPVHFQSKN